MEITKSLDISDVESKLVDMHSFLNVLSALGGICYLVELEVEQEGALKRNTETVEGLIKVLGDPEAVLDALKHVQGLRESFMSEFDTVVSRYRSASTAAFLEEERDNLENIFDVVMRRSTEMIARLEEGPRWVELDVEELRANFQQFFDAVEKNAKGQYYIVHNIASHDAAGYLIHFDIKALDGATKLRCPDVLVDVMRDLIANARKYTAPGGTIDAGLTEEEDCLRFAVRDTGAGIPAEEVEQVVDFGYRASNTRSRKTLGGGFGLTKAYQFVKQNGGRFWIDSALGAGTTVRFEIPKVK